MTIVLDCNIIVMCLTSKSVYHEIYQALIRGDFNLAVSDDIVLEYEEIVARKYSDRTAKAFVSLLRELPNVIHTPVYFNWHLIHTDVDDNKYVDCAISAQAEFIATEDRHFNILKEIPFPNVVILSINEFMDKLN